jgi:hypothetical protein
MGGSIQEEIVENNQIPSEVKGDAPEEPPLPTAINSLEEALFILSSAQIYPPSVPCR